MNLLQRLPFFLCLIIGVGLVMSSCGDGGDEPEGEAPKTKFIGDYVGQVSCAGVLASVINDPALSFSISDTSPAADDRVQVNLPSLPIPLELTGTVTGQDVAMDQTTVNDVSLPFNGLEINVDVTASGDGKLVGNALTATIFLSSTGDISTTDECTITANKQ